MLRALLLLLLLGRLGLLLAQLLLLLLLLPLWQLAAGQLRAVTERRTSSTADFVNQRHKAQSFWLMDRCAEGTVKEHPHTVWILYVPHFLHHVLIAMLVLTSGVNSLTITTIQTIITTITNALGNSECCYCSHS
jgi:ABC-type glycerol-3-phosphate transport system permease component